MKDRFTLLTIITSFMLLGIILVTAPRLTTQTYTTTSDIVFRYGVSGAKHMNELNTLKGIFIKDMVNKEPVWTKLDFTQEDMDTIYQKMIEIDFFSYPRGYQPKLEGDVVGEVTPFSIYYLEYKSIHGTKIVQWNTKYWAPEDTKYMNLKELANLIIEIIQAKPEYKKLPEPTAGYA